MFDVYVDDGAWRSLLKHFEAASKTGQEAMGLLLGNVYSFEGRVWVFVEEYVTAGNDASSVSVRFTEEGLKDLVPLIAARIKNGIFVGWAHSHPGYGCFLSGTDLSTQRQYFSEGFNVALVVDPLRGERKFFRLSGVGYTPVSFAVVKKK